MDATTTDIYEALINYRCQYSIEANGNGAELLDVITPPDDKNVTRGRQEIKLLAEHIADELFHRNRS